MVFSAGNFCVVSFDWLVELVETVTGAPET